MGLNVFSRQTSAILAAVAAATIEGLACGHAAVAQGLNAAIQTQPLTLQGNGVNTALTIHRDALARPCLDIEAAARRHVVNPKIFDHVISVYNRCLKPIKLHVCYYNSEHCIDMEVSGLQRKDEVLGIYPNSQFFRYSYKEKF